MHVGSVLDMARPVTRLLLKVFPVESVRVLLKKKTTVTVNKNINCSVSRSERF